MFWNFSYWKCKVRNPQNPVLHFKASDFCSRLNMIYQSINPFGFGSNSVIPIYLTESLNSWSIRVETCKNLSAPFSLCFQHCSNNEFFTQFFTEFLITSWNSYNWVKLKYKYIKIWRKIIIVFIILLCLNSWFRFDSMFQRHCKFTDACFHSKISK